MSEERAEERAIERLLDHVVAPDEIDQVLTAVEAAWREHPEMALPELMTRMFIDGAVTNAEVIAYCDRVVRVHARRGVRP